MLNHLGIIIDGNRRWAKEKGLPTLEGHRKGFERVKNAINWAKKNKIKIITFFCFSTENWKRSKTEINYLMELMRESLLPKNLEEYGKNAKIKVIGQKERLSKGLQKQIEKAENETKDNKDITVNFAISYGGRAELISAFKNIIEKKIPLEKITEQVISDNLWTSDLDMIIRTGKEQRISNFLIWQAAYSELYFSPIYWPDFDDKCLDQALEEYNRRTRRFGK